jgi:hypothetical protein
MAIYSRNLFRFGRGSRLFFSAPAPQEFAQIQAKQAHHDQVQDGTACHNTQ